MRMLMERARVRPRRSATKPKKIPPMAAAISVSDMMPPATPADMCSSFCAAGITIEYSITSMLSSIQPSDAARRALRRAGSAASCQKVRDSEFKVSARDIDSSMALRFENSRCMRFDLEFAINQILQVSIIVRQAVADDEMEVGFVRGLAVCDPHAG